MRNLPGLHERQLVDSDPLQVKQVALQAGHELPERYLPELHDRQLFSRVPLQISQLEWQA